ncbi:MAG: ASPIC/UnbV domain-containing protein, partial [Lysobacterales bacterium]
KPIVGRGLAASDVDGDGDLDLLLTQVNGAPLLLRNDQRSAHHWLSIRLRGRAPNTEALGARVTLETPAGTQHRSVSRNRSYLSQTPSRLHFGLGDQSAVNRLAVRWPDGTVQPIELEGVDREIEIVQP